MVKRKILLVEDNCTSIDILVETLSDEYSIMIAKTAEVAMALAIEHLPDLVLMDIVLPDIDGLSLYQRLKRDRTLADIPVIFLSGMSDAETKKVAFASGAKDFIEKPFDVNDLRHRIARVLE